MFTLKIYTKNLYFESNFKAHYKRKLKIYTKNLH